MAWRDDQTFKGGGPAWPTHADFTGFANGQGVALEFDGQLFLSQQVIDHLRVADVIGELLVGAFDFVAI